MRLASERRTIEARIERLRRKAASAADPSNLMREIRDSEANLPVVPPVFRIHVDDCTPERLASLMVEQGGRMQVFSDEGGVFELLAGRYSKGIPNLDLWLKGHSVSQVRVDRADPRRPPILLDRPSHRWHQSAARRSSKPSRSAGLPRARASCSLPIWITQESAWLPQAGTVRNTERNRTAIPGGGSGPSRLCSEGRRPVATLSLCISGMEGFSARG